MNLTDEEEQQFQKATMCHICGKECFDDKVRDHCRITGKYRGCAHNKCNLDYNFKNFKIPVFFHNLKGYDGHFIIEQANKFESKKKPKVIAQSSGKFMVIEVDKLEFKDSFAFLTYSLDKLVRLNKYVNGKKRDNWENNFRYSLKNSYAKNSYDLEFTYRKRYIPI